MRSALHLMLLFTVGLSTLLGSGPPPVREARAEVQSSCLRIFRMTAFAPRGQVYVDVQATCGDADFAREDPLLAYLEVMVGDVSVGEDVRVYSDAPSRRFTFEFRDLPLAKGDPVLARLGRFGEILDLHTVLVP